MLCANLEINIIKDWFSVEFIDFFNNSVVCLIKELPLIKDHQEKNFNQIFTKVDVEAFYLQNIRCVTTILIPWIIVNFIKIQDQIDLSWFSDKFRSFSFSF